MYVCMYVCIVYTLCISRLGIEVIINTLCHIEDTDPIERVRECVRESESEIVRVRVSERVSERE